MLRPILPALLALPLLTGCISTVAKVVTAPVRIAGKAVDLATTSQSEADEKRGRQLRKQEEEQGRLDRENEKQRRKCDKGDEAACARIRT